jgi:hypothetical protein
MTISKLTQTLLDPFDRLPDHRLKPAMRDAVIAVRAASEGFTGRKIALQSDGRMTARGQQDALMESLTQNHGKQWARARAPIVKARKEHTARRAALVVKPMDPADLVGAVLRQEIRAWIRSLDVGVRQSVVLGSKDRRVLEAALSAPPELSGITNPRAASEIEARYVEIVFPRELAELEAEDAVIAPAEAAVGIAYNEMRSTVDMHPHDFSELMRPIETIRPWLIDGRRQVCETGADGKPTYRKATEADLADGVEYENFEAYKAAQGLADAA